MAQVVTTVDGYDEDYEKGKAAGIKMVRRMSMARLQRKYSEDPIDKHSDFGARLRLNAGAESQERILSGADSITSDIEHTDYEGLVIENYKRNLRGYSPDSVDLKGHSPDIPEPMVSRYSKHLADGSPKSGSLKNQGTWAETSVIEKISIPETKEEFEMTLTRSPDFLIEGVQCTPEEYILEKHKWTYLGCIIGFPYRIKYFFHRIFCVVREWIKPPDLYDPDTRRGDNQWPFLELQVTFNPSREKAVLYYFQALSAQKRLGVEVEFDKIAALLDNGADINAKDEMGKTVLHAACREERLEVIQFLVEKGAALNTMDKHGRTPLHMAAAMDNYTIIGYLCDKKADYGAITHGDIQTPLHYAAKNDAPAACKVLVEQGAKIEAKDYRGRTPLLLAAELDRSVAASALMDLGASAKMLDYTGYHPICAMIKNMPDVAMKALDQCYSLNTTSRQQLFWLNYLEPSLISSEEFKFPSPSVLEEVVKTQNQVLINHAVVKEMIKTKWSQFGIFGCVYELLFYLFILIIWSTQVLVNPYNKRDGDSGATFGYNDAIAIISLLLYIVLIAEEVVETWEGYKEHRDWRNWKLHQIRGDLKFVLPENVEEKIYLEDMEEEVINQKSPYWSDFWNVYDWAFLVLLFFTYILFWIDRLSGKDSSEWKLALWKSMFLTVSLVFAWIKLFKYLKVFESMGPFVVIISNTFGDVLKIMFVFFILYIPASCVFFQFFGSSTVPEYSNSIMAVFFTVFRMIMVDDYYYSDIMQWGKDADIPESWIHILISYWLMMSAIILLNLFIALMSDTFQRIYEKAIEVAALQRAETIVALEKRLAVWRRDQFLNYIKTNFAPKISYVEGEKGDDIDDGRARINPLTQSIVDNIKVLSRLSHGGPLDKDEMEEEIVEEEEDEAAEAEEALKRAFEEQELTLRQALHVMS